MVSCIPIIAGQIVRAKITDKDMVMVMVVIGDETSPRYGKCQTSSGWDV